MGSGQSGRDVDDLAAQCRSSGEGMGAAGQDAGGAQQVVGDGGAEDPGGGGAETPRRQVRQGAVDEVGEHGFDDGVLAVGDVGLGGGQLGVGQKRVVPPYGEQRLEVVVVLDPAPLPEPARPARSRIPAITGMLLYSVKLRSGSGVLRRGFGRSGG